MRGCERTNLPNLGTNLRARLGRGIAMFRKRFRVTPQPPQPPARDPVEATLAIGLAPCSPPADFSGEKVGEVGPREGRPPRHGFSRGQPGSKVGPSAAGWSVGDGFVPGFMQGHPSRRGPPPPRECVFGCKPVLGTPDGRRAPSGSRCTSPARVRRAPRRASTLEMRPPASPPVSSRAFA